VSFRYIKASHLDASAAVKLVLQERGSEHLSSYFAKRAGFYITSVCLAEALGVFKRKRLRDEISEKQYLATCYLLLGYLRSPPRIRMDEIELSSLDTFAKAEEIARRHKLDLSDSLQLVSVKHGRSSSCVPGFKTVLITADRALASAAKAEGLRVWNCEEEATPPAQCERNSVPRAFDSAS
jgi:predicted nucleic acid-binding protein